MPGHASVSPQAVPQRLTVLIVGAGPAGAAAALALCRAGVEGVALLEEQPAPAWRIGESATPDVPELLGRLGLAMPEGHRPYQGNAVLWDGPLRLEDFRQRGQPPGWQLDRARFDQQLRAAAQAAGATLLRARLDAVERSADGGWHVQLARPADGVAQAAAQPGPGAGTEVMPMRLSAQLLVDASGRRAALARLLGARRHRLDQQVALALRCPPGTLARGTVLEGRVLVEAVRCGWWYAAELPGGELLLSLMTDQDLARALHAPQAWCSALAGSTLRGWLDGAALEATLAHAAPQRFAAHAACTSRVAGPGWMAVGDALLSLDPLTSSGISGALRDALEGTRDVLLPWLAHPQSPEAPGQAWGERARQSWQRFLRGRQQIYAQVQGWPDGVYWQRRQVALGR